MTSFLGCQTSKDGYGIIGTAQVRGLLQVMAADRGEMVGEVIQGDLVGSRAVLAHDVRLGEPERPLARNGPVGGSVEVG